MVLLHNPSVYNHSCQWPVTVSGVNNSTATAAVVAAATSHLFTAYDLFRCTVVLTITFGLIAGNILLAMATNCKYSASILHFQVFAVPFINSIINIEMFSSQVILFDYYVAAKQIIALTIW